MFFLYFSLMFYNTNQTHPYYLFKIKVLEKYFLTNTLVNIMFIKTKKNKK